MARTTRAPSPRAPETTPASSQARVYALGSGKGGVGKTSVALGLGAAWRDAGRKVALLDLDGQGGLTLAAGVRPPADPLETTGVSVHGMTLWPSGRALALADADQLDARLSAARAGADIVIVDLSPALSDAGHSAALAVADPLVVVARLDAAGLPNVEETVALAQVHGCAWRVVPTFKGTTGLSREAEAFLRGRYGATVTETVIPTDARAAEAPSRRAPVLDTAPRSKVSVALRALAEELLIPVPAGTRS